MATVGSFSRHDHLNELRDPLDSQEGVLSPAERRRRVLANLGIVYDGTVFDASVAVAGDVLVIPVTARYVAKTTAADAEALTLANGLPGQRITIELVVDGGGVGTLTPATATGFSAIVFADAGDVATLEYVDDTVGWILIGAAGALDAGPAITQ